jgi:hypothetical protein
LPGRWGRYAACATISFLQFLIGASGNYTFFNLLTVVLALSLLDDTVWQRLLPRRVALLAAGPTVGETPAQETALVTLVVGWGLLALSALTLYLTVIPGARLPAVMAKGLNLVEPLRSVNDYGLFRVMTRHRQEIIVEGSDDGRTWQRYDFKYKPGDLFQRPRFIEPHQPRLDWQMWFAALANFDATPWFQAFLARLLQGAPEVLGLLRTNPFPSHPPTYVRALLYDYEFSDAEQRARSGVWWTQHLVGAYSPVLSLRSASP